MKTSHELGVMASLLSILSTFAERLKDAQGDGRTKDVCEQIELAARKASNLAFGECSELHKIGE